MGKIKWLLCHLVQISVVLKINKTKINYLGHDNIIRKIKKSKINGSNFKTKILDFYQRSKDLINSRKNRVNN